MATYNPPPFPRKPNPKHSNILSDLQYEAHLLYYRYEITTGLYVMSPGEKLAYNLVFFSFLVLVLSAVYYCLPSVVYTSVHRLVYYFRGTHKLNVARIAVASAKVLRSSGNEAARSLSDPGQVVNATSGFAR